MIESTEQNDGYVVRFTNGSYTAPGDMPVEKGGFGQGFRPHELLEAALATCLTMTVRIAAEKFGYPLIRAVARVELDRGNPEAIIFNCALDLDGELDDTQRARLLRAAEHCPVGQTLAHLQGLRVSAA
jgi:putative redox protein